MPITDIEAEQIASHIRIVFSDVIAHYDHDKYPKDDYVRFSTMFRANLARDEDISLAMRWKWGHLSKSDFPASHHALIAEIQRLWPSFQQIKHVLSPWETFAWWKKQFARQSTYITNAFIAHLVHADQSVPIIDQHNFRGMHGLIRLIRPSHAFKKKPSNWADIVTLTSFLTRINAAVPGASHIEFDHFLMMYGKHYVPRRAIAASDISREIVCCASWPSERYS